MHSRMYAHWQILHCKTQIFQNFSSLLRRLEHACVRWFDEVRIMQRTIRECSPWIKEILLTFGSKWKLSALWAREHNLVLFCNKSKTTVPVRTSNVIVFIQHPGVRNGNWGKWALVGMGVGILPNELILVAVKTGSHPLGIYCGWEIFRLEKRYIRCICFTELFT